MQLLIPAAGMGSRLGIHTNEKTKCMVEVNGVTLIERALNILVKKYIDRIIMVVGYKKDKLIDLLGDSYQGIPIVYIHNDVYDKTNNIYSIFLAKDELIKDDTILLESDLIFNEDSIDLLLKNEFPNLALVDKYKRWMDGTVVMLDSNFDITSFVSGKNFNFNDADHYYKTVNIYKFSKEFLNEKYVPFLDAYSKALGNNEYYEQVLKIITLLETKDLKALPLNGEKWYEIDDAQDLDNATVIFSDDKERSKLLAKRYGGYWRYEDVSDYCYLVNPYFPNSKFIDEMKFSFETLLREYPSGASVQSLLAAKLFDCKAEQIVVGNGAAELIDSLARLVNGKLGLFLPTFEEYSSRFQNIDTKIIESKDFSFTIEDIISFSKGNDGFILINPDNPSGNYIKPKDVIELIEWFDKNDKILIIDESFVDFSEDSVNASLLSSDILEKSKKLIVIKSISKSYGVPGVRLGVLASADTDLIDKMKKSIPVWNINSYGEYFLQIIGKYKKEYTYSCEKIASERSVFFEQIKKLSYLKPISSQANYILCEVVGITSKYLTDSLAYKYNLLIKDCSKKLGFAGKEYVRIAVKSSSENQKMLDALFEIN